MIPALVIDDDNGLRESLVMYLQRNNMQVKSAGDGETGLLLLEQFRPAFVILDVKLPGRDGLSVLKEIQQQYPETLVVIITAFDVMDSTIRAIQCGAFDYIEKPFDLKRLQVTIDRARIYLDTTTAHESHFSSTETGAEVDSFLIGSAPAVKEIFKQIGQVSNNRVTVLVSGESGTGKELVARVIHTSGITSDRPFVAVNCTAIPDGLLESELFGHVRGSFTDAVRDRMGRFELAADGTIFLDEICELSLPMQAKLLRVLQERSFEPVGGEQSLPLRARVIAASNQDVWQAVREKRFREDLYYRINVCHIHVPPLRERVDDIPRLVLHFVRRINEELGKCVEKVPFGIITQLQACAWPGNVRELENAVMRAMLASRGDILELEPQISSSHPQERESRLDNGRLLSLRDVEKRQIGVVLDAVSWDKKAAAAILGISRPTLMSKIREYELHSGGSSI